MKSVNPCFNRKENLCGRYRYIYTRADSKDNPLLSLQNVVTLPHIGSATLKTRQQMAMTAAENLVAGLQGKTPPNIVRG